MQRGPNQAFNLVTHPPQRKIKEWEWNSVQHRSKQLLCLHGNLIHKYSLGYGKRGAGPGGAVLFFQKSVVFYQLSSIHFCGDGRAPSQLAKQVKGQRRTERKWRYSTTFSQVTRLNAMVLLKIRL